MVQGMIVMQVNKALGIVGQGIEGIEGIEWIVVRGIGVQGITV